MIQQFGHTDSANGAAADLSKLRLSEGSLDISWHHCSTTADFLGDFFAVQAKAGDPELNEIRHAIGYLVNELLENAVKFRAPGDIEIEAHFYDTTFGLSVQNRVHSETAERFQALLTEITSRDPGELLIERIEQNAADPSSSGSGLGLLTLMSDYGARLGWKFIHDEAAGPVELQTYAALSLS